MPLNYIFYLLLGNVIAFDFVINSSDIDLIAIQTETHTRDRIFGLINSKFFLWSLLPDSKWPIVTNTSYQIPRFFGTGHILDKTIMTPVFADNLRSLQIPITDRLISWPSNQTIRMRPCQCCDRIRVWFETQYIRVRILAVPNKDRLVHACRSEVSCRVVICKSKNLALNYKMWILNGRSTVNLSYI